MTIICNIDCLKQKKITVHGKMCAYYICVYFVCLCNVRAHIFCLQTLKNTHTIKQKKNEKTKHKKTHTKNAKT